MVEARKKAALQRKSLKEMKLKDTNETRELMLAESGAVLDKVDTRGKREKRWVRLSNEDYMLKWGKDMKSKKTNSQLDLNEVIRIDYGRMARAAVPNIDTPPWLCFSLYTASRSFDFVCPDEETTQAFTLAISRMCDWASGSVPSRSRFITSKALCKIDVVCEDNNMSRARLFMDAIDAVHRERGEKVPLRGGLSGLVSQAMGAEYRRSLSHRASASEGVSNAALMDQPDVGG